MRIVLLLHVLLFFHLSCSPINIQANLIGTWKKVGNGELIEITFNKKNKFEIKIIKDNDLFLFNGDFIIDNTKVPYTINFNNISNFTRPLFGIIKIVNINNIIISKFSTQWKLRPISFYSGSLNLIRQIIKRTS